MDVRLAAVAETLAQEFRDLPCSVVVQVLSECVDEHPYVDVHFVAQAARARLSRTRPDAGRLAGRSSLDVSLHDQELADEVELVARLIVAANELDRPLAPEEVDHLLGLAPAPDVVVIPQQREAQVPLAVTVVAPTRTARG